MAGRAKHDWDAIKRDYERSADPVRVLCARHRVSRSSLYYRVLNDGWKLRKPAVALAKRTQKWLASARGLLIDRLQKVLERQLERIERQLAQPMDGQSAADRERDARASATLMRVLERLCELARAEASPPDRRRTRNNDTVSGCDAEEPADDARQLRRELAERLARLRADASGGRLSGDSEDP